MKLLLIVSFLLLAVMSLPSFSEDSLAGQSLGETDTSQLPAQASAHPTPVLSTPTLVQPDPNSPPATAKPEKSLVKKPSTPVPTSAAFNQTYNQPDQPDQSDWMELSLLDQPLILENQKAEFTLPTTSDFWLEVKYRLETEETLNGFDRPGFTLKLNDELLFQVSAAELSTRQDFTYQIKLDNSFSDSSQLELWAGNSGDDLEPTRVIIQELVVKDQSLLDPQFKPEPSIENLHLSQISNNYLTLSWTGDQLCRFELRSSQQNLTEANWSETSVVEILEPAAGCSLTINQAELLLLKRPNSNHQHLALRDIKNDGSFAQKIYQLTF